MFTYPKIALATLAALVLVARGASAQPAAPDVTDLEFNCMRNVVKHGAKSAYSRLKCVTKCMQGAWKGYVDPAECQPPYGGATATCLVDSVYHRRGVEDKYLLAIRKACDATLKPGRECPACYSAGGDCSQTGAASDWVQNIAGQADSFVPGIFCEVTGADLDEQNCQKSTARGITKYFAAASKCYDKCYLYARRGIGTFDECAPPATDGDTNGCLTAARAKYRAFIDQECHPDGALPECGSTYPDGDQWLTLAGYWLEGNIGRILRVVDARLRDSAGRAATRRLAHRTTRRAASAAIAPSS
jgi:hypothetical protein